MSSTRSPHLLLAVTHHTSARFLRGQPTYFSAAGYRVSVVSSDGPVARDLAASEPVRLLTVDLPREISPLRDARALGKLLWQLTRDRPDVVNAGTPKAGLLVLLAAALTGVRCRVYTMRGLRLESARGPLRRILWLMEWLTCRLAHRVVCISPSLRARALELKLLPPGKAVVIGGGSSNGIDLSVFRPDPGIRKAAESLRHDLGISSEEVVVGFVGRLARAKGVPELLDACERLRRDGLPFHLLLAGAREDTQEAVSSDVIARIEGASHLHWVGEVSNPLPYYGAMDLLVLPSHREGFGNVLIEAAAMGLPVITSRIPGCVDAVAEGATGLLVEPQNTDQLAHALRVYVTDARLRREHGENGRARVLAEFGRERIWDGLQVLYRDLMLRHARQCHPESRTRHRTKPGN